MNNSVSLNSQGYACRRRRRALMRAWSCMETCFSLLLAYVRIRAPLTN
jgi:hypothetical protein